MMKRLGDIKYYRGDTEPIIVKVTDSQGNGINLTGYSFILTVDSRSAPDDTSTRLFTINGTVDPDQSTNEGIVRFPMTEAESNQEPGTYYYDIQRIDTESHKKTLCKYRFFITQDLTK